MAVFRPSLALLSIHGPRAAMEEHDNAINDLKLSAQHVYEELPDHLRGRTSGASDSFAPMTAARTCSCISPI